MKRPAFRLSGPVLASYVIATAVSGAVLTPRAAEAWWRGGFYVGIPGPVVVGPPVVYAPPPAYYAPPPDYYAPAPGYSAPPSSYPGLPPYSGSSPPAYAGGHPGRTCYAGGYTCPLDPNFPVGSGCSCPTGQGLAYGRAG